jgi:hypothetical protein
MTKAEFLAEIAEGRTITERLPLYKAAMDLGLLTYSEIQQIVWESAPVQKTPVAKKTAAKKAAPKTNN